MAMAHQDTGRAGVFQRLESLHAVLEPLLDQIRTEQGSEYAFIVLVAPDVGAIKDVIGLAPPSPLLDVFGVPPQAPAVFHQCLQEKRAAFIAEASRDLRFTRSARGAFQRGGVKSAWIVPLLPASAVLVTAPARESESESAGRLLAAASELGSVLWEHIRTQEWQEASTADLTRHQWLTWMLNAVPDPLVLSDEQNNIVYQNEHAKRLFESRFDDSPGKRRAIELNNFLLSTALSSFVLDQGASLGREFTAVDPIEGSELLFEVICQPLQNPTTGERHLVSVLRNVTDLHRAIEELRSSLHELQRVNSDLRYERDRLNLVLEHVADPIVVTGPANEIILVNASANRLLQAPDDQGSEQSHPPTYYTNDAKFMAFLLDLQLGQDDVQQGELQLVDPALDEEMAMTITSTKVKDSLGQLTATVSVLHDLTQVRELERRRLEHQLYQSEKLAAMGRLAAAVAHEINNPLESIKNALHLLRDDVPEVSPNRKFLDIATKETERVSRIIRQMLGFYRGGTSKSPINLNGLIEEAIATLQRQFTSRRIQVLTELSPELPLVTASSDQLKQVFLNLFLNAEEIMEGGGRLTVTTRLPRGRETRALTKEHVLVEVRDTGAGIAKEHLDNVFEPFFSTKRERGGTGLGLWVCQDIIKHHGGEIRVHSRLGQGTAFTIALPIQGEG